ncbi:endonuclease SmrB [Rosenbergiella sp. S61]|uniref:Ribosome rescue factor SmrB n=1 Tax=Rosenbergiella gaditana TaxID=2726987 RepID=A0ABS5SVP8_9GAMM|nr:endonuclease SmrB [Rosenbergiella gaditana]MBT0724094.1 endonuclease SmrB [Rosenbergiella gaditana]
MSSKNPLDKEDLDLFRTLMGDTRRIKQDTVLHPLVKKIERALPQKRLISEQVDNSHYFSDEYQPLLAVEGAVRYTRADVNPYEVKKLRRGDYTPEICLDLHGLTQQQAKKELGAMIAACRRERLFCASVMHGHGKHILKQQIPLWLAQHPYVMAFHQAPKMFGGNAAILMLIEVDELITPLL